jgi:hypothetical protein
MQTLEIGPLSVSFQRTVRVKDNNESCNLPPSLGIFDIHKVSDYKKTVPQNWDEDAYFITMHDQEAMWMHFQTMEPVAVNIGAGKINSLNGKELHEGLEKDGYVVTPPQPWLDGWKGDDGSVYQFVSARVGQNKTIGEQLAKESNEHGISISVYRAKEPEKLKVFRNPVEKWGSSIAGDLEYSNDYCCKGISQADGISDICRTVGLCGFNTEMGLGKGGKIKQKIYEDPHGIDVWKEMPEKTVKIYLINASEFAEITGKPVPQRPVCADDYSGTWFGLKDEQFKDVEGTTVFDDLKGAL